MQLKLDTMPSSDPMRLQRSRRSRSRAGLRAGLSRLHAKCVSERQPGDEMVALEAGTRLSPYEVTRRRTPIR